MVSDTQACYQSSKQSSSRVSLLPASAAMQNQLEERRDCRASGEPGMLKNHVFSITLYFAGASLSDETARWGGGSEQPVCLVQKRMNRVAVRCIQSCVLGLVLIFFALPTSGQSPDDRASVVVTQVVEREVRAGHRTVGTVIPIRSSTVGSAVDGRVVEFFSELGDAVTQGQPLAKLRTETLEIELAARKVELQLHREELAELQNGSRPEEIAEARARMLAARAVQKNSETRLRRIETLFERNSINETDLDDAREREEAAQQMLLALEAMLKRIEAGPRKEQIAQAQARVALQNEKVRLIEDRISKFTICTPFAGFISAEHTEVGEWIAQGDPVADVIALNEVDVRCGVPAKQAVKLERGIDVRIEFPELPGENFSGTVTRIVPTADMPTRTFPVNIRLQNRVADGRPILMAGMLARAILPTGQRSRRPLVPKDALVLQGSRREVYVVETTGEQPHCGRVQAVPVSLGISDGSLIQVDAPLRAGQLVVVLGNERLRDGQEVVITQIVVESEAAARQEGFRAAD